uniref:Protein takeout-like protein n=1 Tax=Maconellicoccus hirsutus TaxID=177089 RepID=A0AAU6SHK8_MACHI
MVANMFRSNNRFLCEAFTVFVACLCWLQIAQYAEPVKIPALPLPSYVGKACRANDPNLNECVVRTGAPVIKRITQGDPKYRIPKLEPLTISKMRIEQGTKQVGMTMECQECQLYGLSEVNFTAARVDLKKRHVEWDFWMDKLMFLGKYKVSGRVLILPITGSGDANITLSNVTFSFLYDYDLDLKENGKNYARITNSTLPYKIGGMYINLENLFNGDKLLGENMNRFLNENWRDIIKEVGPAVADALTEVFRATMGAMADLVPFEYLFPSD